MFFDVIGPSIVLIALVGLIIKFWLDLRQSSFSITILEYVSILVVFGLIATTILTAIGWKASVDSLLSFNEYWNGSLTQARIQTINCTRDGDCVWEYKCDPYNCNPYPCEPCTCTARDDEGKCTNKSCAKCYQTCWHDCPYCNKEYNYVLDSTVGTFTIASNRLPEDPNSDRWRSGERVPNNVINNAGTGAPDLWTYYSNRLNEGISDPVSIVNQYENLLLANDETILNEWSDDIDDFKKQKVLPKFRSGVEWPFYTDKVYFVNYQPTNADIWQDTLMRFNAAFGSELQGDLHLVIVQDTDLTNFQLEYLTALKAYWQNKEEFGDNTLAKNTVLVVLGTEDGQTIRWARATTGMPIGNVGLIEEVEQRVRHAFEAGTPLELNPLVVLGDVQRRLNNGEVTTIHTDGYLEDVIWGITEPRSKFQRESMKATDENDKGTGYSYLRGDIEPEAGHKRLMVFGSFLFSLFGWAGVVLYGVRTRRGYY